MPTWSEKEMREVERQIISGLKANMDFNGIMDCLRAPEAMKFDALCRLVEQGEIDVIVT